MVGLFTVLAVIAAGAAWSMPRRKGMKKIAQPPRARRKEQSHTMKEVRP